MRKHKGIFGRALLKSSVFLWVLTTSNLIQAQDVSYKEEIHIQHDGPVYLTGDRLRFSVTCLDQSNRLLSPLSRLAYVELLDSENTPLAQSIIDLNDGKGKGDILLPFTATSGNYTLRAYTKWMRNFPPEDYAYSIVTIVNPFKSLGLVETTEKPAARKAYAPTAGLSISTPSDIYRSRQKVTINLGLNGVEGRPANGLVSVSVSKVPDFFMTDQENSGKLPVVVKKNPSQASFKPDRHYLPETKGQFLTGKVYESGTTTPKANELIYLSIIGTQPEFYTSKADSEGIIRFEIVDFYGQGEVHLQSSDPDANVDIVIDPSFSEAFVALEVPSLNIDEKWESYLTQASQNMQVRNVYSSIIPFDEHQPSADSLPFYGIPDQKYYLDDYTRFPLMEEVLREYVAGIFPRKRNDEFYFKMVNVEKNEIMNDEPLMLYDGLPIKKANTIMELDPRLVKRIDIVTKRYLMGGAIFEGITSFHSYKGDLTGLDPTLIIGQDYSFVGVQRAAEYVFPDYEDAASASTLPDFRNTLYWTDSKEIDNGDGEVEFFTSDDTGTYLIEIEGISDSGDLISQKKFFKVEK
ncbi:MAG: hypothetical protein RIF36_07900 [Imperialibacter sp.]|uniref:hypothetical protein n=1 Tax=Imperialibacter sp. TaxID=2038411 RepID=UPI0032EE704D